MLKPEFRTLVLNSFLKPKTLAHFWLVHKDPFFVSFDYMFYETQNEWVGLWLSIEAKEYLLNQLFEVANKIFSFMNKILLAYSFPDQRGP